METLDLLLKWERYFKRTLGLLVLGLMLYGAYKHGYKKGMTDMFNYIESELKEDKEKSLYQKPAYNEGEPGKMWEPEA
jgi:hypothetical protein